MSEWTKHKWTLASTAHPVDENKALRRESLGEWAPNSTLGVFKTNTPAGAITIKSDPTLKPGEFLVEQPDRTAENMRLSAARLREDFPDDVPVRWVSPAHTVTV